MENEGGKLHVVIDGDASELKKALNDVQKNLSASAKEAEKMGNAFEDQFSKAADGAKDVASQVKSIGAAFLGFSGLESFVKKVYEVRSYFQDIESNMRVFLGSADAANKFTKDLQDYAYYNMFDFADLADASKQLIAYGNATEDVIPILDKLSNVAKGTNADLEEMVNLYNRAKNLGTVNSHMMQSWAGKGLVLNDVLKEMGQEASNAGISFQQLNEVLDYVTGEGGMFHGLMDEMMDNLSASLGQLQDNMDLMFNEIGEAMQEPMRKALDTISELVDHYKDIVKVLAIVASTYGVYKAAVAAAIAIDNAKALGVAKLTLAENAHYVALVLQEKAQALLNKTMLANPYVAAATALTALVAGIIAFNKRSEESVKNSGEAASAISRERSELESLYNTAKDETRSKEERASAIAQINAKYGDYMDSLIDENASVNQLASSYDLLTSAITKNYLEKLKSQTVGEAQSNLDESEASLNGYLAKIIGSSGISSKGAGALTGAVQRFIEDHPLFDRTSLYNGLINEFKKYGIDLSDRQKGSLYKNIDNYLSDKDALKASEKSFEQFAEGYKNSMVDIEDSSKNAALASTTSINDIIARIKNAQSEITRLQAKAKSTGLTDADDAELKTQLSALSSLKATYKNYTGNEYGKLDSKNNAAIESNRKFYEDLGRKTADAAVKARRDIANMEIDAMDDGDEKVRKRLELDHKNNLDDLKTQHEERLRTIMEHRRSEYMAKHNGSAVGFNYQATKTDEDTEAELASLKQMNTEIEVENERHNLAIANADKQRNEALANSRLEYFATYGSYEEKQKAIIEKYNNAIVKAANDFDKKILEQEKDSALKDLEKEYSTMYQLMFASVGGLTDNMLAKAIEITQKAIDEADQNDIKSLTELYARLNEQLSEQSSRSSFGFSGLVKALKEMDEASSTMDFAEQVNDTEMLADATHKYASAIDRVRKISSQLSQSFSEIGSTLQQFDGILGGFGSALAQIGVALSGVGENLDNVITAFASKDSGEIIGAGISSMVNLVSMVANQIKDNKEAQDEWAESIRQSAHEYAMMNIEALKYQKANIFGVENPYSKAIAGAKQYAQAMSTLNENINALNGGKVQTGTKEVVNWGNVGIGAASGAGVGAAIGSFVPVIGTSIGAAIGGIIGGVAGGLTKKVVPILESLSSKYSYIVGEDYKLNPQILADYDQLDESTKKIVDNWEEIRKAAEEAEQEMRQNFYDLAGYIGNQLSDSLVNAFRNGDLYMAIDDFRSHMNGVLEDILEKLIFSNVFQSLFDELEQNMVDSFGVGGDNDITDDLMDFTSKYGDRLKVYEEYMKQAKSQMASAGYDLWSPDRTASATGVARADQDSVNELNGRATAIQGLMYELNEGQKNLSATSSEILVHVMGIHEDTQSMNAQIGQLVNQASQIKSSIDTITDRGVKMLS